MKLRDYSVCLIALAASSGGVIAQTIDDAVMIPSKTVFGGVIYTRDTWDHYWEGLLQRSNGNLGAIKTQTNNLTVNLGILDRLNVIANFPYIWTEASQGVLSSMQGWQDVTIAAKYRIGSKRIGKLGSATLIAVPFIGVPLTDYQPDFQPLSIGLGSRRGGVRTTLNLQSNKGFFITGTSAYTWRANVTLDRPYYFTQDKLFLTSVVEMPDSVDYAIMPGYLRRNLMAQFTFSKLITEGGGDIRRQDQPFISNRFISSRVGAVVMYPIPKSPGLTLRFEFSHVVDGRNVGRSNTFATGLLKTISFQNKKRKTTI